ncbi:dynein regulatory complex protein 9-like isoform X2 [Anticarsia gemmatalis]|uniref:dynein regulatory complex protein 9-like isoform X2 n=1 Tax=Anticarsia gemmatalis TaxID=129554 RepID=UPI003F7599F6
MQVDRLLRVPDAPPGHDKAIWISHHENHAIHVWFQDSCQPRRVLSTVIEDENEDIDDTLKPTKPLSYMMSSLYAGVLDSACTQIRCLEECNIALKVFKVVTDQRRLKAQKFDIKQQAVTDELEGIDEGNLNCDPYKVRKLDADRQFVNGVLQDLFSEVATRGTYDTLKNNVRKIYDGYYYVYTLKMEEAERKATYKDLRKQTRQQRNRRKTMLYETNVTIENLKTKIEDFVLRSAIDNRYTENWQTARAEQNNYINSGKENCNIKNIAYFKQCSENEQRIHSEIGLLLNITMNETLAKIDEWMEKFDNDIEKIDLEIQIRKNDYQDMRDKRMEMEAKFEQRDKSIKDWLHFKEEREEARLYNEKMIKCAITVQAWWRGLLVRLQLGPYAVKRAKRGKKAKNDKKKSKK